MKHRKVTAIVLTAAICAGAVFGIGKAVQVTTSRGSVPVLQGSDIASYDPDSDSQTSYGLISAGASQNVYLSNSETVKQVCVKEGDAVKEGQVLLIYDPAQSQLALQNQQINVDQIKLNIEAARQNLDTLSKITPVPTSSPDEPVSPDEPDEPDYPDEPDEPDYPDEPDNPGEPVSPDEPDKTDYTKALALISSLDDAYNLHIKDTDTPDGSREHPYRFLVNSDTEVSASFLKELAGKAEEIRNGKSNPDSTDSGENSSQKFASDAESSENPDSENISGPQGYESSDAGNTSGQENTEKPDSRTNSEINDPESDKTDSHFYIIFETREEDTITGILTGEWRLDALAIEDLLTKVPTDTPAPTGSTPTAEPAVSAKPSVTAVPSPESTDVPDVTPTPEVAAAPSVSPTSPAAPSGGQGKIIRKSASRAAQSSGLTADLASGKARLKLMLLASDSLQVSGSSADSSSSNDAGDGSSISSLGLISPDAEYTKEDLENEKKSQQENLRDQQLNLREANLKLAQAQRAVDDGVVKASMTGIVKNVGDPDNPPSDGSAFITVAASEGMYLRGAVSELMLGSVKAGNKVELMSWSNGASGEAVIKDISPYPDTSGMFSDSSYNSSSYPFTALISSGSGFENGDYVQVTFNTSSGSSGSQGFFISKAFVRDDGGTKYVYVRSSDNLLHRRDVIVNRSTSDGYRIVSGATEDDWFAFPYGKSVKEGAKTREGTYEDLYS